MRGWVIKATKPGPLEGPCVSPSEDVAAATAMLFRGARALSFQSRRRTARLLLGACCWLCAGPGMAAAIGDLPPDMAATLTQLDPHNAIGLAAFVGLVIFATTTAILYLRERQRWTDRERILSHELADLR